MSHFSLGFFERPCLELTTRDRARRREVLEAWIFEPAFDVLRTKKTLAYSVEVGYRKTHKTLGFGVCVRRGGPRCLRTHVSLGTHLCWCGLT